jgi:hypothetical protein
LRGVGTRTSTYRSRQPQLTYTAHPRQRNIGNTNTHPEHQLHDETDVCTRPDMPIGERFGVLERFGGTSAGSGVLIEPPRLADSGELRWRGSRAWWAVLCRRPMSSWLWRLTDRGTFENVKRSRGTHVSPPPFSFSVCFTSPPRSSRRPAKCPLPNSY